MSFDLISPLKIGDIEVSLPIIQGGMGVRVSGSGLASACANAGCMGVIATAGIGQFEELGVKDFGKVNEIALREEIRKARKLSDGVIGVNIMVALNDYEHLVRTSVDAGVDAIISGAGLPLSLPEFAEGGKTKLIPVVSSVRSFELICRRWKGRYGRLPDAVIVEGPYAGGHLGYSYEDVCNDTSAKLEDTVLDLVKYCSEYSPAIPVIAAGGIFYGADIANFLKLGASGVQMATRFVCTDECDAHINFKQAYIDAVEGDLTIIKSPVGLPGRAIKNEFVEKILAGKTVPFKCNYRCLRGCDPSKAPYCIAKVLANAAKGILDESFVFAGSNAWRCDEIVPVKELVGKIVGELQEALGASKLSS